MQALSEKPGGRMPSKNSLSSGILRRAASDPTLHNSAPGANRMRYDVQRKIRSAAVPF